jgi:hypothetical protein
MGVVGGRRGRFRRLFVLVVGLVVELVVFGLGIGCGVVGLVVELLWSCCGVGCGVVWGVGWGTPGTFQETFLELGWG